MLASGGNDAPPRAESRIAAIWLRLSARERLLLAVLAGLALIGAVFKSGDWSADQRERYAAAQADMMVARQARQASSGVLDASTRNQLATLTRWTTSGRNIWMARIDLERSLAAAADQAGLPQPEIRVAEGLEGDPALPVVKVEIDGAYAAEPFRAFLQRLTQDERVFVVERLRIESPDTARYRLELLFPVTLGPDGGA